MPWMCCRVATRKRLYSPMTALWSLTGETLMHMLLGGLLSQTSGTLRGQLQTLRQHWVSPHDLCT